eukprot:TRINITY_DN126362_c0_g1_i1.p1 TRINITY_DN126362_c0_g1~~TRINITY_DN126362_c0_g1_i1.p1  ORF type:complete len:210 (-),score=30.60 TRINITY_DN126362_c0_g1_i1:298-927(-)
MPLAHRLALADSFVIGVAQAAAVLLAAHPESVLGTRGSFAAVEPKAEASVKEVSSSFTSFTASLDKQRDLCLSIDNNYIKQGAKVQAWTCLQSYGQQFTYYSQDSTLRAAHNPEYCVVTGWNKAEYFTKVQLWKCNEAGPGKHWIAKQINIYPSLIYTSFAPVGNAGACLGVYKGAPVMNGDWANLADAETFYSGSRGYHHCFVTAVQL